MNIKSWFCNHHKHYKGHILNKGGRKLPCGEVQYSPFESGYWRSSECCMCKKKFFRTDLFFDPANKETMRLNKHFIAGESE